MAKKFPQKPEKMLPAPLQFAMTLKALQPVSENSGFTSKTRILHSSLYTYCTRSVATCSASSTFKAPVCLVSLSPLEADTALSHSQGAEHDMNLLPLQAESTHDIYSAQNTL